MSDGKVTTQKGFVKLHPTKGTDWSSIRVSRTVGAWGGGW